MAAKSKPIPRGYWIVLGALVFTALYLIGRPQSPFARGQDVMLWRTGKAGNVLFARDRETFESLYEASKKGSLEQFLKLGLDDKVRGVTNGTHAIFLSGSGRELEIQITEGPQKGIVGFVEGNYVRLSKPGEDEGWTRRPISADASAEAKPFAKQAQATPRIDDSLPLVLGCLGIAAAVMFCVYLMGPKRSPSR